LAKIILLDAANAEFYIANAESYIDKITSASESFADYLKQFSGVSLFYVGHNALEDFAEYFAIEIVPLEKVLNPGGDLTGPDLVDFIAGFKLSRQKVLFTEELKPLTTAQIIQGEIAKNYDLTVSLLELHGYHNVNAADFAAGVSYFDLLERNITNIKISLNG
jgi:zinc transport system substrate-binding protein